MDSSPENWEFLERLFPEAGPELLRLYAGAQTNANLLHADLYTIRDLLELSGYQAQQPLHALLLLMLVALDEGSLCVELSLAALKRRLNDLVSEAEASDWSDVILGRLSSNDFPDLIGLGADDAKPVIRLRTAAGEFFYFQKYLKNEQLLLDELNKRLDHLTPHPDPPPQGGRENLKSIIKEVLIDCPVESAGRPLELNRDQRLALGLALLEDFVVITGGPGTGKTSIIFTLLRCLVRTGVSPERIALAAPTGRAAQRLTDAIVLGMDRLRRPERVPDAPLASLTAHTLHHLLRYNPSRGTFGHHAENPLPHDVVIVDEVSMVGLVLMAQLFQALRPKTKLILLGDRDQLSSVDAGAVLANLAPPGSKAHFTTETSARLALLLPDLELTPSPGGRLDDMLVVLQENYRSQQQIQEVARQINLQVPSVVERLPLVDWLGAQEGSEVSGCWLLDQRNASVSEWRKALKRWAERQYLNAAADGENYATLASRCVLGDWGELTPGLKEDLDRIFAIANQARVLTLLREGPWGCLGVNRFLEEMLRPRLDPASRSRYFSGALVLVGRNDYSRQLFNGDVGILLKNREGGYRAVFQRQRGYVSYPAESLPAHEPALAITVHKSQGSEYGEVLLVLPPEGGRRLLTREIIYTGITRAKDVAVIAANKEVLKSAIARRIDRDSALLRSFSSCESLSPVRRVPAAR